MTTVSAGKLLVASPILLDPNFHRTVVLVLEHSDEGAVGVVLNRPLEAEAVEFVPAWGPSLNQPGVVFFGGPVQNEVAVGLAHRPHATPSETWHPLPTHIGLIDLGREPDEVSGVADLRVFSGYAGWDAEQLEFEIATGSWFVLDPIDEDAFSRSPEELWRSVLRRQRSRVSLFADFPPNLRVN